ncbi:hypothetical protein DCAR_0729471 [Daucus carota subsp. sativus]|uniref:Floricaula/leafy-like transcription factor n=1 Tax=Daucus carota subsp. sativus TaxID=79200 RepID=A0A161ZQ49_DAUCS|nr:PREDICTED: floricaula/leafy homolog isoform X1 [Daucus carota subsp. sativus]WOH10010.1 hypothetical protein DCAR_0729471 [Daucus carota subsp. sativus]
MDRGNNEAFVIKWDTRNHCLAPPPPPQPPVTQPTRLYEAAVAPPPAFSVGRENREVSGLVELFQAYGIRYYTAAKIAELGFTVNTLLDMRDEELDEMMNSLSQIFRWDLLVGERYGIKASVRAERRRLDDEDDSRRLRQFHDTALDALSQEGLSEEHVQQEKEAAASGGGGTWEAAASGKKQQRRKKAKSKISSMEDDEADSDRADHTKDDNVATVERQREHPFIVTEPGEVARGKKNGLDYLFHLYEQCREFLVHVQSIAKEKGEKCPTKVTNQVFRYAKKAGASYINKPKMRHYVHCYALHCLDEEASNALRRLYKERGENVGAWRQACYKPLVAIAAQKGWDIDLIFNTHPRLSIWYVPTKLRQLCHAERSCVAASAAATTGTHHLTF